VQALAVLSNNFQDLKIYTGKNIMKMRDQQNINYLSTSFWIEMEAFENYYESYGLQRTPCMLIEMLSVQHIC
jgi:hypothetical protein